jgi:hypothetical protein
LMYCPHADEECQGAGRGDGVSPSPSHRKLSTVVYMWMSSKPSYFLV